MALTQLAPPYPIFTDKSGSPLDAGYLYFGEVNKNPETNPIQVYYDRGLTQPVTHPVRTSNGYVMRNGSPTLIYAGSPFSVTVRNKNSELVIYSPIMYGFVPGITSLLLDNAAKNVPELLADTSFSYDTLTSGTIAVSSGDILRTLSEGFAYKVAASGATDHQVSTAGGVKLYIADAVWTFEHFGAVGDYLIHSAGSSSVNPSPTDDTSAIQAAVTAGGGNQAFLLTRFYYTTAPILNPGVLHLKSPNVVSHYVDSAGGQESPYGIANLTTDMFETDPVKSQSSFNFQGLEFWGASGTTLFSIDGLTQIVDYFNVHMFGCRTRGFGIALDGSMGSWLWKLEGNMFGQNGSHDIALKLRQPHNARIIGNQFSFRNRIDIQGISGGVATSVRDNSFDCDVAVKECCIDVDNPQSWQVEHNYIEQYNYGVPITINSGRGTDPFRYRFENSNPNHTPVMRGNYINTPDVARVVTVGRVAGDVNVNGSCSFQLDESNTLHSIGVSADAVYHDQSGTGRLLMPKPRINRLGTVFNIGDPSGLLFFYGNGAMVHASFRYTNPASADYVDITDPTDRTLHKDDKVAYLDAGGRIRTIDGPYRFTVSWNWESAVALGDWRFRVFDSSPVPDFEEYSPLQSGTEGSGTITHYVADGDLTYFNIRPTKVSGVGTLCDRLFVDLVLESLDP